MIGTPVGKFIDHILDAVGIATPDEQVAVEGAVRNPTTDILERANHSVSDVLEVHCRESSRDKASLELLQ